jgi:C-terminal peptidase prc
MTKEVADVVGEQNIGTKRFAKTPEKLQQTHNMTPKQLKRSTMLLSSSTAVRVAVASAAVLMISVGEPTRVQAWMNRRHSINHARLRIPTRTTALQPRQQSHHSMQSRSSTDKRRKRKFVKKMVKSSFQFLSFSSSSQLGMIEDSNDAHNSTDIDASSKHMLDPIRDKWEAIVKIVADQRQNASISELVQTLIQWFQTWKTASLAFVAGIILTLTAVLVPIYSSVETVSQPVTLLETIFTDLQTAYVDEVDLDKLFATGMNAMLNTLDPYTEFESANEATAMTESIQGKYGGIGLVITAINNNKKNLVKNADNPVSSSLDMAVPASSKLLPDAAQQDNDRLLNDVSTVKPGKIKKNSQKKGHDGIRVVSAFEGYAFDYGLRVGDTLVAVDNVPITGQTTVEAVRNMLRGDPGTTVSISFQRQGVVGTQSVVVPRTVVRLRDVKLAALLGNKADGIGYIQLTGFASDAGREVRNAIHYLQQATEDASNNERTLQGLVLDLRNNPGGLLTSAVDVASLLVPKGSDIVSARGRGFPGVLYRSRVDPIIDTARTKLVVLTNRNTASAAEIVSGAIQDLDVGIVMGADRTFGKGLVQNVEDLPFNTALKFTVAKYYTPSGRCIQGINYEEGGLKSVSSDDEDADDDSSSSRGYKAIKIAEGDRGVFYTKNGRVVRDGGGIEADVKVDAPKASALEITLLRSGVMADFAALWSAQHELPNPHGHSHVAPFEIDEETYRQFQAFVNEKQRTGEIQLEALYNKPLQDLRKTLEASGMHFVGVVRLFP